MSEEKKYDVAISFLGQDESHAEKLYDALRERLDVFYYAERQPDLVSRDGEEAFGSAFRDQARVVVIFYRDGWGETPFSRAERSAIKQRAFEEGYGFTVWVPVGENKSTPAYVDPQFLWYDFDRWGVEGLCSIVEKRVRESGRKVRPETVKDRLRRRAKSVELAKKRSQFIKSKKKGRGSYFVKDAKVRLEEVVSERIKHYEGISPDISFQFEKERGECTVSWRSHECMFFIDRQYSNVALGSRLNAAFFDRSGNPPYHSPKYAKTYESIWRPTLDSNETPAWTVEKGNDPAGEDEFFSLEEVVARVLDYFAEVVYMKYEERLRDSF